MKWGVLLASEVYIFSTLEGDAAVEADLQQALGVGLAQGEYAATINIMRARKNRAPLDGRSTFALLTALEVYLYVRKGRLLDSKEVKKHPRHEETELARSLGTAPVIELHGTVKIRAGRVLGVYLGPRDMAEMLAVAEFTQDMGRDEALVRVGTLRGVEFLLLDEDLA